MTRSFANDTRLRIVNLLKYRELSVTQLCEILDVQQGNVSKHLSQLQLTEIINDRRKGPRIYYSLVQLKEKAHQDLMNAITIGFARNDLFTADIEKMKDILGNRNGSRKHL